jgi:hypothetical protein
MVLCPVIVLQRLTLLRHMFKHSLSSKYKTWIELPPELRPEHWQEKFIKPVVLLVEAL